MAKLDLGKMVGPLPLGGWAAVVAGGLGIGWFTRRARATPAPEAGDNPTSGMWSVGPALLGASLPGPPPPPEIVSNSEWQRVAVQKMVDAGEGSAYATDQALAKYLAAQTALTPAELALVEKAIRLVGPPPQPPGLAPSGDPVPGAPPPPEMTDWSRGFAAAIPQFKPNELRKGNPYLWAVRDTLAAMGFDLSATIHPEIYDKPVEEAVRALQRRYGRPETGLLDYGTRQLIAGDPSFEASYRYHVSQSSPEVQAQAYRPWDQ